MQITPSELNGQLAAFGETRIQWVIAITDRWGRHQFSYPARLLAIASRESWITNIEGDGGHGKGAWQIDNRSWMSWLSRVAAVRNGTWGPVVPGFNAINAGFCPTLQDSVGMALFILREGWNYALQNGVPMNKAAHVMVAGYNAGPGNALAGYHQHGNPDAYTTGGEYSSDVFERETIVNQFFKEHHLA